MRRLKLLSLAAVVVGIVLGMGGMALRGDDVEAAPEDDIEAMLEEAQQAYNERDFETFLSFFTPEGAEFQFFETDPDLQLESVAGSRDDTGPILSITVTDLFVTSGNATGIVDVQFEMFSLYEKWSFYFIDGGWKIGAGEYIQREVLPEGIAPVELYLDEYAFLFDPAETAGGNFAFQVTNVGEEAHEVVVFRATTDDSLPDLLAAVAEAGPEGEPEGVEFVTFGGVYDPGTESTALLPTPLDDGRYLLLCFFPSPDDTPHAFLGMAAEFNVTGGGGITPPSTGDAGLLGEQTGAASLLLLVAALTFVLAGTGALLVRR